MENQEQHIQDDPDVPQPRDSSWRRTCADSGLLSDLALESGPATSAALPTDDENLDDSDVLDDSDDSDDPDGSPSPSPSAGSWWWPSVALGITLLALVYFGTL